MPFERSARSSGQAHLHHTSCSAAALALHCSGPGSLTHCMVGHSLMEPGHRRLLALLGLGPLLDLDLRLGEGTGEVLATVLVRAALRRHLGMATFTEAGVHSIIDALTEPRRDAREIG
ncbi:MAG: nicotinate-nucleotide--dimethylbenzimidazole phosphoribosyltransferase [Rhizobium sp.]|nr:nicotinate-nucleotide--dimethylbenzimidazole phosphoribosyltransferase [Rhizobium sp.]